MGNVYPSRSNERGINIETKLGVKPRLVVSATEFLCAIFEVVDARVHKQVRCRFN